MAISEPGEYIAKAVNFDFGKTEKGNDFIQVSFQIEEGEVDSKSFITWRGFLTDAAAKWTFAALRNAGWTGDALGDEMPGLGDTKVRLVIEDEEYEDKVYKRVRWVNRVAPAGAFAAKNPLHGNDFSSLNARLGMKIKEAEVVDSVKADEPQQAARLGQEDNKSGAGLPNFLQS